MKTIPQVRDELLAIAKQDNMDTSTTRKIKSLVKQLYRRPAVRRAAKEHATMTAVLRVRIDNWARLHPNESYASIGRRFNVSNGRVSEIVAGKRAA